jgi:serine/threonine protein phosphatase 1
VPPRTIAIGDIHGCLVQFEALLQSIAPTKEDHIILLGDYVDRGPDSAGVLTRIIKLMQTHHVSAIMGNHEELMLDARNGFEELRMWLGVGGMAVLASYFGPQALTLPAAQWKPAVDRIPKEHWTFLETRLLPYLETDTHIFVHAAADPGLRMNQQMDVTLRWTSCEGMRPHISGKTIICGHTAQHSGRPRNFEHYVCIDTHAYGGKYLTALDVHTGHVWQADAKGSISQSNINDYAWRV